MVHSVRVVTLQLGCGGDRRHKKNYACLTLHILVSTGNFNALSCRSGTKSSGDGTAVLSQPDDNNLIIVDREALWLNLERGPELHETPSDSPAISRSESEETEGEDEEQEEVEEEESEHTESADASGAQNSTENSSSGSAPYLQTGAVNCGIGDVGLSNGLLRVDSDRTQASDSLSSDEDDGQLEALAKSRVLKRQRERQEAVDSLFRHILLYRQPYEFGRVLYAFSVVETLVSSGSTPFVEALSSTALDSSSTAHLNLVQNLLQRHRQAEEGGVFYGPLQNSTPPGAKTPCQDQPPSSPFSSSSSSPSMYLLELLTSLCLRFLRSQFPSYATVHARQLQGNREVQVK